ncbi:unnamed protein product, partial [Allacma fusca]
LVIGFGVYIFLKIHAKILGNLGSSGAACSLIGYCQSGLRIFSSSWGVSVTTTPRTGP